MLVCTSSINSLLGNCHVSTILIFLAVVESTKKRDTYCHFIQELVPCIDVPVLCLNWLLCTVHTSRHRNLSDQKRVFCAWIYICFSPETRRRYKYLNPCFLLVLVEVAELCCWGVWGPSLGEMVSPFSGPALQCSSDPQLLLSIHLLLPRAGFWFFFLGSRRLLN